MKVFAAKEYFEAERTVDCPFCGSPAGHVCWTVDREPKRRAPTHQHRLDAWRALQRMPERLHAFVDKMMEGPPT